MLAKPSGGLGITPKTVARRGKRAVEDMKTGPREPHSTFLIETGEAMIGHKLLPLDDCFHALQPPIPHLPHTACIGAYGNTPCHAIGQSDNVEWISRLPHIEGHKPKPQHFKRDSIEFDNADPGPPALSRPMTDGFYDVACRVFGALGEILAPYPGTTLLKIDDVDREASLFQAYWDRWNTLGLALRPDRAGQAGGLVREDTILRFDGNDRMLRQGAWDLLLGSTGFDTIPGGSGNGVLFGESDHEGGTRPAPGETSG